MNLAVDVCFDTPSMREIMQSYEENCVFWIVCASCIPYVSEWEQYDAQFS